MGKLTEEQAQRILTVIFNVPPPPPPKTERELIKEKLDEVWPQW